MFQLVQPKKRKLFLNVGLFVHVQTIKLIYRHQVFQSLASPCMFPEVTRVWPLALLQLSVLQPEERKWSTSQQTGKASLRLGTFLNVATKGSHQSEPAACLRAMLASIQHRNSAMQNCLGYIADSHKSGPPCHPCFPLLETMRLWYTWGCRQFRTMQKKDKIPQINSKPIHFVDMVIL